MTEQEPVTDTQRASPDEAAILRRCNRALRSFRPSDGRFRKRSLESIRFFFGDQWTKEDKAYVESLGQPPIVINRIKPTVKLATGLVISQPLDWLAKPVGIHDDSIADTATAGLKHIARLNHSQNLTAKVYHWALTYGVGWAYAGFHVKDTDPRSEPVQHVWVDSREVRWDPDSREDDLSDAGWVIWSRRVKVDKAISMRPDKEAEIRAAATKKDPTLTDDGSIETCEGVAGQSVPHSAWADNPEWNQFDKDDENRQDVEKVVIHEMWERVPTKVMLMEHRDGWTHEFDPNKPEDVAMLQDPGVLRYYEAEVPKMHQHIWCGNVLLHSDVSDYNHDRFPLIPCWYERDENGDPVSMVEALKDPQREINHRRSKAIRELNAPNVRVSQEALGDMDEDEAAAKLAKGGALFVGPPGSVEIMARTDLASNQYQFMQDSKAEIQAVSGANDDLMGYDSSSKSGVAKQAVMQQGQTMMRPAEAQLRLFHQLLGEITVQLIQQAHTDEWVVRITDEVGRDKFITANKREVDPETGMSRVLNDIRQVRFELEVDAAPWTPTTRERAVTTLGEMVASEPDPMVRAGLRRMQVIASDWPNKAQILQVLDKAEQMAMGGGQPSPEQQAAQQLQMQGMAADVANKEADAAKKRAETQKTQVETAGMMTMPMAVPGMGAA